MKTSSLFSSSPVDIEGPGVVADTTASTEEARSLAVAVRGLAFAYGARRVFENFDLSVPAGTIFGLLGPNGGGKSTLFRIVSTALLPNAGTVQVFGLDAVREAMSVRRLLGVVFQAPSLDKKLTVAENLECQGILYGLHGRSLRQRIAEVLELMGVAERSRDRVGALSGGLQRRVEIAKSLLHRPRLLVLDEPSTGLDLTARRHLMHHLVNLRCQEQLTVLLTTHLLDEGEQCDRVAILDAGRLVAQGAPAQLVAQVGSGVLWLESQTPDRLLGLIESRWGLRARQIGERLRVELSPELDGKAPRFVVELIEAASGLVQSVTLAKPSLEDVFIRATGHSFVQTDSAEEPTA